MSYEVIKTIRGRRYRYLQTSYREDGKVRTSSIYLGPVDGGARADTRARKAADEKFRQVLRDNVFKYGSSRPGARYASEARAREQYHRDLGFKPSRDHQKWAEETSRIRSDDERSREAQLQHMIDAAREEVRLWDQENARTPATDAAFERYMDLKAQVEAEVHEEARSVAQTERTEEAPTKSFTVDDEIDAREAQFHVTQEEVNAWRGYDPAPTEPPTDDAPAPDDASPGEPSQPDAPSSDGPQGSCDGPQ